MLPLLLSLFAQGVEPPENDLTAPRSEPAVTTTSARVTVVTGEELRRSGQDSLPRAIGKTTGLWVQETNYGGGAPVIRGLLGNRILILVDGVRLNDSTTRQGPNQSLNTIDLAIVDRVEVSRGPASVLYGSDAMGGVINIWTRRRPAASQDNTDHARPYGGELGGTYNTAVRGGTAYAALEGALEEHSLITIGSLRDFNDLTVKEDERIPFIGYKGHSLFGAYEYAVGDRKTIRLSARLNSDSAVPRTDKLLPGFNQPLGATHEQYQYTLQDRRGFQLSYTDNKPGRIFDGLQVRASIHRYREQRDKRKWDYADPDNPVPASTRIFEEELTSTGALGMDWKKAFGDDHLFTLGFDLGHDDVESERKEFEDGAEEGEFIPKQGPFAPGSQYTRSGVYLQDEVIAFDPLYLTAGLRYSYYDYAFTDFDSGRKTGGNFDALTASVEAARDLGRGLVLTASLAQGYRVPSLDDLANRGSFASGDELANTDLDPEESLSAELGMQLEKERWSGTAAAFATRIDDYIGRVLLDVGDPDVDGDELYQRANTGQVDLLGFELAGRCKLFEVDSPFSATASLTYVRGTHDDPLTGSSPARRIPPMHGRVGVLYEPEHPFFRMDFVRFHVLWADNQDRLHPQDVNDPRIDPYGTPGWTTYNVDVGGRINPESDWWFGIYNLTDTHYRVHSSGFDGLGVRAVIGVKIKI